MSDCPNWIRSPGSPNHQECPVQRGCPNQNWMSESKVACPNKNKSPNQRQASELLVFIRLFWGAVRIISGSPNWLLVCVQILTTLFRKPQFPPVPLPSTLVRRLTRHPCGNPSRQPTVPVPNMVHDLVQDQVHDLVQHQIQDPRRWSKSRILTWTSTRTWFSTWSRTRASKLIRNVSHGPQCW